MTEPPRAPAAPPPPRALTKPQAAAASAAAVACCLAIASPLIGSHEDGAKTRLCTYRDPIVGIATGPGGLTGPQFHLGQCFTPTQAADMILRAEKQEAGEVYARNTVLGAHPYQFAAATSLRHNIGLGAYRSSMVAARFDARQWAAACDAILLFDKATIRGLRS